jgi:uncharacterized protein YjbI with pentapeptide repeats
MITAFSSSEQSPLNGSQWSQASSGIWVPITPRPTQHQSSPPHQDETQSATEEVSSDQPASSDREGWQRCWAERGWPWRREPEIAPPRKAELTQRRAIPVDMDQGIYPFGGVTLTRADIEWLLATHDGRRGPVDWNDVSQRTREGLDLRGAVVSERTDLSALPLARLRGGLSFEEWRGLTEEQRAHARLCLKRVDFSRTHLEGALLWEVRLEGALLWEVHLDEADLSGARLEGALLWKAYLERANLRGAYLEGANLSEAHLERADLREARLDGADLREARLERALLREAYLERADLRGAYLEGALLWKAHLERADLRGAYLERANLSEACLERANLSGARLEGALLWGARLEGANLWEAHLERADLREARLEETDLSRVSLASADLTGATLASATGIGPALVDVKWGETNLSVVDWSHVQMLGDEYYARRRVDGEGQKKTWEKRHKEYQYAHRANHQLAVKLQDQGLVDDAARFAYRAKCLKRTVLWYDLLLAQTMRQRLQMSWPLLFSWALFLLAGYGYRLRRCLFWYVGIVLAFMLLYWWLDPAQLPWWVALGESVNVFHGRGAAPSIAGLSHPVRFTLLTVAEAIIGLVIEIVFVATVIQRLFGK